MDDIKESTSVIKCDCGKLNVKVLFRIKIHSGHRYHAAFSGPTATRCCSCSNRNSVGRFQTNCSDFESRLNAECDAIVTAVKRRQQQLIANARREKTFKQQSYRDQVSQCTAKVHRTTGLLQYSVEVMKEADQTAFLQVKYRAI